MTLTPATASVAVGKTTQLAAVVAPEDATNKSITFKSSDNTLATVDGKGLVTAVKAGEATITVTTADGGKIATSKIAITEPA